MFDVERSPSRCSPRPPRLPARSAFPAQAVSLPGMLSPGPGPGPGSGSGGPQGSSSASRTGFSAVASKVPRAAQPPHNESARSATSSRFVFMSCPWLVFVGWFRDSFQRRSRRVQGTPGFDEGRRRQDGGEAGPAVRPGGRVPLRTLPVPRRRHPQEKANVVEGRIADVLGQGVDFRGGEAGKREVRIKENHHGPFPRK